MQPRLQRTGGIVMVTPRLESRTAAMAVRMQRSGIAVRLVWVSDEKNEASLEMLERLKMAGVDACQLDPWAQDAPVTAGGED